MSWNGQIMRSENRKKFSGGVRRHRRPSEVSGELGDVGINQENIAGSWKMSQSLGMNIERQRDYDNKCKTMVSVIVGSRDPNERFGLENTVKGCVPRTWKYS